MIQKGNYILYEDEERSQNRIFALGGAGGQFNNKRDGKGQENQFIIDYLLFGLSEMGSKYDPAHRWRG